MQITEQKVCMVSYHTSNENILVVFVCHLFILSLCLSHSLEVRRRGILKKIMLKKASNNISTKEHV